MKKWQRWLPGGGGLVVIIGLLLAGVVMAGAPLARYDVKWHKVRATTVDSTAANIGAGIGVVDTTVAIDMSSQSYETTGNTTAYAIGKLFIYTTGTVASTDTLFVFLDVSPDGTNWITQSTATPAVLAAANDKEVQVPVTVDGDAAAATTGGAWGWHYWRWRIQSDNNSAALFPSAQLKFARFR